MPASRRRSGCGVRRKHGRKTLAYRMRWAGPPTVSRPEAFSWGEVFEPGAVIASPPDQHLIDPQSKRAPYLLGKMGGTVRVRRQGKHTRPPGTLADAPDAPAAQVDHQFRDERVGIDASLYRCKHFTDPHVEVVNRFAKCP